MEIKTIKTIWSEKDLKHNTHIIETENGCVLIDAGASIESVKELCDKPIEAVFITHGHFDHIQYIEDYDELGIPIYINEKTKDFFVNPKKNVSDLFDGDVYTYDVESVKTVKNGDKVAVLGMNIKCYETPGHSEDGMCYVLNDEILFSGDTLFSIAVGRTDLYTGNVDQLIKSLTKIQRLKYSTLYAGHGRQSTKEEQSYNIPKWKKELKNKDYDC